MIICGIDPGYDRTGYAFLRSIDNQVQVISYGLISTDKCQNFSTRILELGTDFENLLLHYKPQHICIEKLFMGRNTTTVLSVAEARGVFRYLSTKYNIPITEIAPNSVKKTISGYGGANKTQMIKAVTFMLNLPEPPYPDDTADALAIAFYGYLNIKQ